MKSMESAMAESRVGLRKFPMMKFFNTTVGITQNLQTMKQIKELF